MKKNFIAILLVLLFVAAPMVAATTDSFNVTTTVAAVGKLLITTASVGAPPHTEAAFDLLTAFGDLTINASGAQTFTAYMSVISNNRSGYTVKMKATPMKSTENSVDSYIDYTVTVNSVAVTTTGSTTPVTETTILTVGTLAGIAAQSHAIALSVDATTFAAAVSGTYTGTVTFNYATT